MNEAVSELNNVCNTFRLPAYQEIPNVGLFLEQVSKYINEILSPLEEPGLTGSMISNYVKKKIIDNPVKKQYGRDQIAYLIYIALAKNVLSLEDISAMINLQRSECETEKAYEYFRDEFPKILRTVFDEEDVQKGAQDTILKKLSVNISVTIAHKIYLDMIFKSMKENNGKEQFT